MADAPLIPCPVGPFGRTECAHRLATNAFLAGAEVHVSTLAPLVTGAYPPESFRCPHGVTYWIEPTGEQIAAWEAL